MRKVAACGFFILLLDTILSSALWAGLVLLEGRGCGRLAGVWAFGAVKWAILHVFTSVLTDGNPQAVLRRLVALLCLLSPVFESGRILMASPPSPNLSMLLLGPMSSSLACVVWEKGLCGHGKIRKDANKLDTRQTLMRVVIYFRPDTLYLIAAFSFLILGVICKFEILTFCSIFHMVHLHIWLISFTHCNYCKSAFSEEYRKDKIVFYIFIDTNKSLEETKTNNALVRLLILYNFPTLSVALSPKPISSY